MLVQSLDKLPTKFLNLCDVKCEKELNKLPLKVITNSIKELNSKETINYISIVTVDDGINSLAKIEIIADINRNINKLLINYNKENHSIISYEGDDTFGIIENKSLKDLKSIMDYVVSKSKDTNVKMIILD